MVQKTTLSIILAVSLCHLINDTMQSLLSAIYPILKESYGLDFVQIGLLTFTFQVKASLLQPMIGMYTDKRPLPYSLPVGMTATLCGMALLSQADTFLLMVLSAGLMGIGVIATDIDVASRTKCLCSFARKNNYTDLGVVAG